VHLETYNTTQISELLDKAKTVGIFPSEIAGVDAYCAGVALYHLLLEKYSPEAKDIELVYLGETPENCSHLIHPDYVKKNIADRTLVVTIDYNGYPTPSLHYVNSDHELTLFMGPVDKHYELDKVKSRLEGANYDVIFTIGVNDLGDLGTAYRDLKNSFENASIINIDNTNKNLEFGLINVIDTAAHSLSSLIFNLAYRLTIMPNEKAAKAILTGITNKAPKF
jgi:nanoRNase/pAp phosphatase (c-di-AMP/oligoRNAs hydrolase)